jgi:hypothetical protein
MIEWLGEGANSSIALRGAGVRLRGYDPTGMTVSKVAFGQSVAASTTWLSTCGFRSWWYDDEVAVGRRVSSGTLLLPLSSDGHKVNWVLVYIEDAAAYDWAWAR